MIAILDYLLQLLTAVVLKQNRNFKINPNFYMPWNKKKLNWHIMDTGKKGTKSIFMQTNFMRHIEENSSIVKYCKR